MSRISLDFSLNYQNCFKITRHKTKGTPRTALPVTLKRLRGMSIPNPAPYLFKIINAAAPDTAPKIIEIIFRFLLM